MSSKETGTKAETAASVYLEMRGYKVLERNWRRPRCEIDIVAEKNGARHFIEVKYRRGDEQGGGLEAVTHTKLRQMQRAADMWVEENEWPGEYVVSAIEVGGKDFAIMSFVENVL